MRLDEVLYRLKHPEGQNRVMDLRILFFTCIDTEWDDHNYSGRNCNRHSNHPVLNFRMQANFIYWCPSRVHKICIESKSSFA